jgi:hypothetical protein
MDGEDWGRRAPWNLNIRRSLRSEIERIAAEANNTPSRVVELALDHFIASRNAERRDGAAAS